jgi:hypothetical protein
MWAGLLASASIGDEPHPSFVSCLRQMAKLDGLILRTAAMIDPKRPFVPNTFRAELTELNAVLKRIKEDTGETYSDHAIDVAIDNLSRLNLLDQASNREKSFKAMSDRSRRREYRNLDYITVAPTDLGYALLKICSGPQPQT